MRSVAFHSAKGGVGRTLALANCAYALARANKNVFVIDTDLNAPGVPAKFDLPTRAGLVEYMKKFPPELRSQSQKENPELWREKLDFMKLLLDSPPNVNGMKILQAGRADEPGYWNFVTSHSFNRQYYFTTEQLFSPATDKLEAKLPQINIAAFQQDALLLESVYAADYLLIDAKTNSADAGLAAPIFWANDVAHFLPHNSEGRSYFAHISLIFNNINQNRDQPAKIFPVITRTPETEKEKISGKFLTEEESTVGSVNFYLERYCQNFGFKDTYERQIKRWHPPIIISECRSIEDAERLTLRPGADSDDHSLSMTHDHVNLLAQVFPELETPEQEKLFAQQASKYPQLSSTEFAWYDWLDLDPLARVKEQVFAKHESEGVMVNSDGEANIAFRVETLHLMLNNIVKNLLPDGDIESEKNKKLIDDAFYQGGYKSGENFGAELIDKFFRGDLDRFSSYQERLNFWAQFDTGTGFGRIEVLYDENLSPIKSDSDINSYHFLIYVKNSSFALNPNFGGQEAHDLQHIFRGYLTAVMSAIFADQQSLINGEIVLSVREISHAEIGRDQDLRKLSMRIDAGNALFYQLVFNNRQGKALTKENTV